MAGITDRLLMGDEDIDSYLNADIDFDAVLKKIAMIRETSYNYLKAALYNEVSTDL